MSEPGHRARYVAAAKAGDYELAEEAAEAWLAESPEDRAARVVVAECRMRRQAFAEAEPLLRDLVAGDPSDLRAVRNLAMTLYRLQKLHEALPLAERVAAENPDDAGIRTIAGRIRVTVAREELFASRPYLEAYRQNTDDLVREDPQAAIGSLWEEVGQLQLDYLKAHGLRPGERLFDLGCGTLRAGRLLIRYLDTGGYTGMDMSGEALAAAEALIDREGVRDRQPVLLHNPSGNLDFRELAGARFDVVLAQSVFTHLLEEHIDVCFANIHRVLAPAGRFFFTYAEADSFTRRSVKDFSYPLSFFQQLGARHGLTVEGRDDYDHPRRQRMAVATVKEG